MKTKILYILLLVALPFFAKAQFEKGDKATLFLVIKQKDKSPVAFEEVYITEKINGAKSTNYTDKNGNVQFQVMVGYTYVINFKDALHYAEYPIPLNRGSMITSSLVYNPPKKKNTTAMDTIRLKSGEPNDENNMASVSVQLSNKNIDEIANRKIYLVCKEAHRVYVSQTDETGLVSLHLPTNMDFSISVDKQANLTTVSTHSTGGNLIIKKTISYDPDRAPEISLNTDYIMADTIMQHVGADDHPNDGESMVVIEPKSMKGNGVPGTLIRLICVPIKKVFTALSDESGIARFIVPVDKMFWVGVEDWNDVDHVIVPKEDRMIITFSFTYEPTQITEINKKDTITQELPEDVHATTARSYCHIIINDYSEKPLADEHVYLKESGSSRVFTAVTDEKGAVDFLLPKGKKYSINFKYENNIDVLDVPKDKGFRKNTMGYTYRGSKNIEDYYANSDRDRNGFFKRFMESKTTPIDVSDKQFAEKTADGFKLNLPAGSPVSTPALAGDEMVTSEGYYSPRFYAFDAKTGHTDWGITLAEGGASNAVYDDGVVIVNTESCTLYAIDSKTGKMLWSKWLSNYLYTTPSIADGKIYTVYANNLDYAKGSHSFVLVCFDLHKGDIVWQSWLDANALASPVIDHGKVYLTTLDGKLSLFDAKDGKLMKGNKMNATTNPLIVNNKVYISTQNGDKNAMETVSILKADDLSLIKKCTGLTAKYLKNANLSSSTLEDMNFAGTRMVSFKNKNYNVMGNKLFCTSPEDGKILWTALLNIKRVDTLKPYATMPIVAGNRIMIGTQDGKIKLYDPNTGKMTKEYTAEGDIWTQPMVHDGWIYASTHEGKMISFDTHDTSLTGWGMWNYSPKHNTAVE